MKELNERMRRLATLPYCGHTPETELAIGAVGLEMNAVYSKLQQMQMEVLHAQEYIVKEGQKDVEETLADNREILKEITARLQKGIGSFLEQTETETEIKNEINNFMQSYIRKITELGAFDPAKTASVGVEEGIEQYQNKLKEICEVGQQYIKLHLGDVSYGGNGK